MAEPRDLVQQIEAAPSLPRGTEERFSGYGVMACPFESGHIICHRRFPASSVGPAYTSIWHRAPDGRWTFYQDVAPREACPRFFGSALAETIETPVGVTWTEARRFHLVIPGRLEWEVSVAPTVATRAMNAVGGLMPDVLWKSPAVLGVMASVAGVALGAGKLRMAGRSPNGQRFVANPMLIWTISESRALLDGQDLGGAAPLREQPRLGDFWIPRTGLFVIGRAFFEPFDAARHSAATSAGSSV